MRKQGAREGSGGLIGLVSGAVTGQVKGRLMLSDIEVPDKAQLQRVASGGNLLRRNSSDLSIDGTVGASNLRV